MEYFLIILLQLLGIGFHVGQKVFELDKLKPNDSLREVFGEFWMTDRVTLMISGLVLLLNLVSHYIIHIYTDYPTTITNYAIKAFAVALILGYGGQSLIYWALGKAIEKAKKIVEDKTQ